ncbi:hypothetical protein [Gilliamella sp. ESL0250]|uniref:hypothetical protein n=1 Tax=Gilliamella sp. ESL0250 TaxID=2705036 RepID=UPI00157FC0B5|nr:hypothetical protein [Gilliamella sp. ESL0250]NUF50503.1 hypothetical protein [Gilliamella sp. ESL0250]
MSHFAVLVIGENPEAQLAPFHEFESTGKNDQYVQDIDITEDVLSSAGEQGSLDSALYYHGLEDSIVEDESQINKLEQHKFGYAIVKDGKLIKAVQRTNPNYQWDWYSLGGRFGGFQLKDKTTSPFALKRNIDFDTAISNERLEAEMKYDLFQSFLLDKNLEFPKTWKECKKEHEDIESARDFYNKQPAVKLITQNSKVSKLYPLLCCPFDYFGKSKDDFIKRCTESTCVTYAVIKDGKWYSKGKMGWFGLSSDDVSQADWNAKFWELVNSASENTLFSLYDCHI